MADTIEMLDYRHSCAIGDAFDEPLAAARNCDINVLATLKERTDGFAVGGVDKLHSVLDVTIAYPEGAKGFWDFLAGRVRTVRIEVRELTLPEDWYEGDYEGSQAFRAGFQRWVADLWRDKDTRIEALLARPATPR